jgi:CheY-like chemotaxis protein
MPFQALLISRDPQVLQTLVPICDEAGIANDVCTAAEDALTQLRQHKYDAVVVDCSGIDDGRAMLQSVRRNPYSRSTVLMALVDCGVRTAEAFELGATFVLEKPVSPDWMLRNLQAAHGLMLLERRRSYRAPVDITIWVGDLPTAGRDLSVGGAGVRSAAPLPLKEPVKVRFELPDDGASIEAVAEVVWSRHDGHCGLRFLTLRAECRRALDKWLHERMPRDLPLHV